MSSIKLHVNSQGIGIQNHIVTCYLQPTHAFQILTSSHFKFTSIPEQCVCSNPHARVTEYNATCSVVCVDIAFVKALDAQIQSQGKLCKATAFWPSNEGAVMWLEETFYTSHMTLKFSNNPCVHHNAWHIPLHMIRYYTCFEAHCTTGMWNKYVIPHQTEGMSCACK